MIFSFCFLVGAISSFASPSPPVKDASPSVPQKKNNPAASLTPTELKAVANAADEIVALTIKVNDSQEGAGISMFTESRENAIVIPYFSNLAGIGLVSASQLLKEPKYLELTKSWERFYDQHRNSDGTLYDQELVNGKWRRTNRVSQAFFDSTDSYAGTHLELVHCIYSAGAGKVWLNSRLESVRRSVGAIKLTLQPNGLVYARPGYDFALLMDCTETVRGLAAAGKIANVCGDIALEQEALTIRGKLLTAMDLHLWDEEQGSYKWNHREKQGARLGVGRWYPEVMANCMAVAWLPKSTKTRRVYQDLLPRLESLITSQNQAHERFDMLVWLGMAANAMDDAKIQKQVKQELLSFDGKKLGWSRLPLCAHVIRVMAGE